MLYFTLPNESPASIAMRISGRLNPNLAEKIRYANLGSIAQLGAIGPYYAPNRFIWIPWRDNLGSIRRSYIVRQLDWLDINKRTMLATFAKRNIDVMTVAHAHQLAAYMNYRMGKDEKEGYFGWLGNTAMDFFGGAAAFEYHHMERFNAAIDDVKAKLLKLKSLAGPGLETDCQEARQEFRQSFKALHELYAEDIKRFKIDRDVIYANYRDMEYLARREGLKILDTPEVRQVVRLTKYCGHLAHGIWVFGIVHKGIEVHRAYEDGGPWIRLAIEDALEIAAAGVIGVVVSAIFTGGGWVVVVAAAATETIGNTLADYLIEKDYG